MKVMIETKKITIDDIELKMTCGACPEQYDAFIDGVQVGYLRLRHGNFTVQFSGAEGKLIYSAQPNGDGIFESDEREFYLTAAKTAIIKEINGGKEVGTITWFEIAKGELPTFPEGYGVTDRLLVYHPDHGVAIGKLWFHSTKYWQHDGGNWQPTHFAYINFPNS